MMYPDHGYVLIGPCFNAAVLPLDPFGQTEHVDLVLWNSSNSCASIFVENLVSTRLVFLQSKCGNSDTL